MLTNNYILSLTSLLSSQLLMNSYSSKSKNKTLTSVNNKLGSPKRTAPVQYINNIYKHVMEKTDTTQTLSRKNVTKRIPKLHKNSTPFFS